MTREVGRPPQDRRPYYHQTKLHALFVEKLPEFRKEASRIDLARLSEALDSAPFTVSRWMVLGAVSLPGYRRILKLAEGRITPDELLPYLAKL